MTPRRGLVWILGLGAFGLAFSITTTAAYLPPLLQKFTDSNTMIAAVLAAEGVFALTLPLVIGPWSDTFKTPMGRRRPFMLAALGPIGFCLAIVAFMPNIWTMTLIVLALLTAFSYSHFFGPLAILAPDKENALSLAIAMVLISIFLIINRKGALSQMVGILSLENAIVSFAYVAGLETTAGLQVGILFDIFIWVVIATVFASMIYRHFGSLNVSILKHLKEE